MRAALAMVRRELKLLARDRFTLGTALALPVLLFVVYGVVIGDRIEGAPLLVLDRDGTAASRRIRSAFCASRSFGSQIAISSTNEITKKLMDRQARAALVIPERTGAALARGAAAPLLLVLDGADAASAAFLAAEAAALIAALEPPGAVRVEPRVLYNPSLASTPFLIPGLMGFLLLMTTVLSTALALVRERELGTLALLQVAGVGPLTFRLAKLAPYLALGAVAAALLLAAAQLCFGVSVTGALPGIAGLTALYLVVAAAQGLVIARVATSQAMAFDMGMFTSLFPAMLLSGFLFEIRLMPGWLQGATYLVPARHYVRALRGVMLKGNGLADHLPELGWLALLATALLAVGLSAKEARCAR